MKLVISLDNLDTVKVRSIIEYISQELPQYKSDILYKFNDLISLIWFQGISQMLDGLDVRIMLDPKWNDIPNTLSNYVQQLYNSGLYTKVDILTLHANSGKQSIQAAQDKKTELGMSFDVLAITSLTSQSLSDTQHIYDETPLYSVLKLTKLALNSWADGVVCSGMETSILRTVFGQEFQILNPGVRFQGGEVHDQKRVVTPQAVGENGGNYVVMGRPILESDDMVSSIQRFFDETQGVSYQPVLGFAFERSLFSGTWKDILSYIGAFYFRPEGGKYCRLTSKLVSNAYINIGAIERYPFVIERATQDMAAFIIERGIETDVVLGAQMGSVRISLYLAEKLGVSVSIYTEKTNNDNNEMALKRHNIDLKGKKIVISEDVVNRGSTLLKMIEIVEENGGEVVAIACVANRSRKSEINGIPLVACYIPEEFEIYYDDITPEEERKEYPQLPQWSIVSPKPKNEWDELVESMRT